MSAFNDGYNAALKEAIETIQSHRQAHQEFANTVGSERPDAAKALEDWQVNDLNALAQKVRRLKR